MIRVILKLCGWVFIISVILIFILIPHLISPIAERLILQKAASIQGFDRFDIDIQTIGISGIGVGNITTGDSISIDSVFCKYSPASLIKKTVNSLNISGLEINAAIKGSSVVLTDFYKHDKIQNSSSDIDNSDIDNIDGIDGIDGIGDIELADAKNIETNSEDNIIKRKKEVKKANAEGSLDSIKQLVSILPFLPPITEIRNSVFTLKDNDGNSILSLPFSLSCKIYNDKTNKNKANNDKANNDKANNDKANNDKANNDKVNNDKANNDKVNNDKANNDKVNNDYLSYKSHIINILLTPILFGQRVNISLEAELSDSPLSKSIYFAKSIETTSIAQNSLRSLVINIHNLSWLSLNQLLSILSPDTAYRENVAFKGGSDITLSMASDISKWNIAITHIEVLEPIHGEINNIVANLTINDFRNFSFVSAKGSFWLGSNMISPLNVDYGLTMHNLNKQWSLLMNGREMWKQKPFLIGSEKDSVRAYAPYFQIYCNGNGASIDGRFSGSIKSLSIENDGIKTGKIDFKLPFMYKDSNYKDNKNKDGKNKDGKKIFTSDGKITVEGITSISLKSKVEIDSAKKAINQKSKNKDNTENNNTEVKADFSYIINPVTVTPAMIKKLYNESSQKQSDKIKPNADNKGIQDMLTRMDFSGQLSSNGSFSLYDKNIESNLSFTLKNGTFSIPEKKININGINTSIFFKGFPDIKPLPAQILTADTVEIKDFKISDAKIRYSIESNPTQRTTPQYTIQRTTQPTSKNMTSILIEQASFNWCDGKVISESIRLPSLNNNYDINLYCDRLKLASVLKQVGSFEAEGDGTLNGRIPISVSDGNITFENGFLYSTPGKGGRIKVFGTEKLTQGIPIDAPEFSQLDLAKEALKSYEYEWARLGFNTQGEQLLVKMEFEGKPEKTLPFVYDKKVGNFVRVNANEAGSNFQGIKIDVNLQLPFNKVLKFGSDINNLINIGN